MINSEAKAVTCQLCNEVQYDTINDASIYIPQADRQIWCDCCQSCFHAYGGSYGIGYGQLIDVQTGEVLKGGSNDS